MHRRAPWQRARGGAAWRVLLGVALALPLAAAALLAWALGTSAGTAWLLAQVPGLQVSAPRGVLAGGAFEAARVHWSNGNARLVVDQPRWADLRWRWRPNAGAWIGVDVVEAGAQRVEWRSGETDAAPAHRPGGLQLPVHARLIGWHVGAVQVDELPALAELRLDAELGADGGAVHRLQRLAFAVDGVALRARGDIATTGAMSLDLQLDAQSLPGRAPAWQGQARLAGPLERLEASASVDSSDPPAALRASATLAPFAAWPLVALQVEASDFDLAALAGAAPRTRLSGRADVRSSALDAPFEADVEVDNALPGRWDESRLPLRRLRATLRARVDAPDTVELLALDVLLGGERDRAGRLTGQGRWQRETLQLEARLDALRPEALDARAPALVAGGTVTLHASGLPSPDPSAPRDAATPVDARLTLALAGRVGALPDAPPLRVAADASLRRDAAALALDLTRLRAEAAGATLELTARAARSTAGAWTLVTRGDLDRFDPLPWWPASAGHALERGPHRIDARWDASLRLPAAGAPLPALRGRARLELGDSVFAGLPVAGHADWSHAEGDRAARADAELTLAGNRVALRGDAGDDRWHATLAAPRLAALAPLARLHPVLDAWLPRAGALQARVDADGRWPRLRTAGELRADALRHPRFGADQARLQWSFVLDAAERPDAPLRLALDAEGLTWGEQRVQRLRASADGSVAAHRFDVEAASPLRPPAWADLWLPANATHAGTVVALRGNGRWQRGADGSHWSARFDDVAAAPHDANGQRIAGVRWLHAQALALQLDLAAGGALRQARLDPGRLQLLDAALRWRELRWADARLPGAGVTVDAEVEPLAVAALLQRLQPDFGWDGDLRLGASLLLRVGERVDADVVVDRRGGDLAIADAGTRQALGLTDLRLALAAHDGVWHFTQAMAGAQVGVLAGAQSLRTTPQATWPAPATPLEGVLELSVANVGVWAPWLPPGWRLGGALHSSASLGGRFGAPEVVGTLTGSQLAVRNVLHGVDVRDGELALTLAGAQARIEQLRFRAGEGTLVASGGATLGESPSAELRLVAEQLQLLGRIDRRIVVSGSADARLDARTIRIDGRLGVDRGLIDFSRADAPALDDDVTVVRRGQVPHEAGAVRAREPRRVLAVNLGIDLGRALRLRGRGLETLLRGELTLTTPGGRPALVGTVRAEDGTYNAYGQRLQIDRGAVEFTGALDNPRLDILAVRPYLDVDVGVEIGGTAQAPRVRLYSDPPMPDADKLSWLLLGRAPDGLGRADSALLQSAALALLAGEGGSPTGNVLQRLGIDELSVAQTGEGELRDTVVTVGKQLSRRWYVAFERGVNATAGSWQLIYRAARRLTIRAQTGEDTAIDVIWTWRWD